MNSSEYHDYYSELWHYSNPKEPPSNDQGPNVDPLPEHIPMMMRYCRHTWTDERCHRDKGTGLLVCDICGKPLSPKRQWKDAGE